MLVTSCWHSPFLAIEFVLFGYFLRSLRFGYGTTCNRDGYLPLGRRTAASASASVGIGLFDGLQAFAELTPHLAVHMVQHLPPSWGVLSLNYGRLNPGAAAALRSRIVP